MHCLKYYDFWFAQRTVFQALRQGASSSSIIDQTILQFLVSSGGDVRAAYFACDITGSLYWNNDQFADIAGWLHGFSEIWNFLKFSRIFSVFLDFSQNIFNFLKFSENIFLDFSQIPLLTTRDFGGRRKITSYATEKYFLTGFV